MSFTLPGGRDALTYAFRSTPAGLFHAYVLPRGPEAASLVVEAPADVIRASRMEEATPGAVLGFCRALFPDEFGDAEPSALPLRLAVTG